ncbi:MAG: hypothetical protein QQN63_08035 [Nitrosopumilus sp.]
MKKSVVLKRMKRPGFYGVIQTRGAVTPLNTALLDEKQVDLLRKHNYKIIIR